MAMTKCKECGAEISDRAETCPKCGAKVPKRTSRWTWLIGGLMLFVVVRCTWDTEQAKDAKATAQARQAASQAAAEAAMTPAQRASAAAAREAASAAAALQERKWQAWLALARPAVATLRAAAKDPESFRVEQAIGMDSGAVCFVYRSKNSFAAVVPGTAVALPNGKAVALGEADVRKHCRQTGVDLMPGL